MTSVELSPSPLDDIASAVDETLAEVGKRLAAFADFDRVWDAVRRTAAGGKLLRPRLLLAAHRAFHGVPDADAVRAATAVEILHLAFLLHDDVIDRDVLRRGSPNVIALMREAALHEGLPEADALRYGESCAILAGDLLLTTASRLIAELDAPAPTRRAMLRVLDDAIGAAAVGEHADVISGMRRTAGEAQIVRTMECKTAVYSCCAPLQLGALLGGATPDAVAELGFIGRSIGIAFQARDDVLGVFGDERATGKSTLSDLREGKLTLLIAHARTAPDWNLVAPLFGAADLDDAGAERLRAVVVSSGALARTEAAIARRIEEARTSLELSSLPPTLVAELESILAGATERTR